MILTLKPHSAGNRSVFSYTDAAGQKTLYKGSALTGLEPGIYTDSNSTESRGPWQPGYVAGETNISPLTKVSKEEASKFIKENVKTEHWSNRGGEQMEQSVVMLREV